MILLSLVPVPSWLYPSNIFMEILVAAQLGPWSVTSVSVNTLLKNEAELCSLPCFHLWHLYLFMWRALVSPDCVLNLYVCSVVLTDCSLIRVLLFLLF